VDCGGAVVFENVVAMGGRGGKSERVAEAEAEAYRELRVGRWFDLIAARRAVSAAKDAIRRGYDETRKEKRQVGFGGLQSAPYRSAMADPDRLSIVEVEVNW
jgi:hypothetical protein